MIFRLRHVSAQDLVGVGELRSVCEEYSMDIGGARCLSSGGGDLALLSFVRNKDHNVRMDHQSPRSMPMKTLIATVALGACLLLPSGELVFAGQPNQECPEDNSLAPGNTAGSQGSPFNEGVGKAGTVYADALITHPAPQRTRT
jgi:hypothetical protein